MCHRTKLTWFIFIVWAEEKPNQTKRQFITRPRQLDKPSVGVQKKGHILTLTAFIFCCFVFSNYIYEYIRCTIYCRVRLIWNQYLPSGQIRYNKKPYIYCKLQLSHFSFIYRTVLYSSSWKFMANGSAMYSIHFVLRFSDTPFSVYFLSPNTGMALYLGCSVLYLILSLYKLNLLCTT